MRTTAEPGTTAARPTAARPTAAPPVPTATDLPSEPWERIERWAYGVAPYLGLAVSVLLTLLFVPDQAALLVVVSGLILAWMASATWRPHWASRGPAAGAGYVTGLVAVQLVLCLIDPWFGFLTIAGYLHSVRYLTRHWRWLGITVTAACASLSQAGGVYGVRANGLVFPAVMMLFNLPIAGGFSYIAWLSEESVQRRKQALTALLSANRRLERLSEENAGLHAQLLVQAREAGVLDERARMAREIHDTLAQGLTGIIAQLQAARTFEGEEHQRHLGTALDLARESLAEARRSVRAMAPQSLEASSLPSALAETAAAWSQRHGVEAEVRVTGTPLPMHAEIESALLRTAQEALTNVAKHASAGRVVVTLSYLGDQVALDVRDDGVGFDPSLVAGSPEASGFGLLSMRQRVQRLAGMLEIDSELGGGTAVSARVPAIGA